ncbi:RNA polymerase-like protein, putative [Leishmania panamensis]|uniref:RNA polymerase-like protein, putative n=5 Tax=Viannia TaxID=37616 RepID=A0A088SGS9_LEIPA|nr:RNA polymerase-like protein, putative [Leishmania panamensis]AIO01022.1 RNA polymerase-like protein, putative [Leishmania panamensis]
MFYKIVLQRTVNVKPADLCNTLNRSLLTFLREAVEGKPLPSPDSVASIALDFVTASKSSAVVIAVLDILNAETLQGKVLDDGSVTFRLTYEAMVLKLHRGEVLDLLVSDVDETGFWASVYGVNKLFVNRNQMGEDVKTGALEWSFEAETAAWVSNDDRHSIKKDTMVRLRVIAETPQSERGMAVGTIGAPFLGPRIGSY